MAGKKTDRPVTLPEADLEELEELEDFEELDPESIEDLPALVAELDQALDTLDYFTLLGLTREKGGAIPSDDDVKIAWHAFALTFHPDVHRDEPAAVRDGATRIFQRGAEAYRVLVDPVTRAGYARRLDEQGTLRLSQEDVALSKREASGRAQDLVRSAGARPFAERADELIASGDLKQARLQLQLALMRESDNRGLQALLRWLDEQTRSKPR